MKHNFLLCGSLGWCLEIFWTGFHALLAGQFTMMGKTSLLMFPHLRLRGGDRSRIPEDFRRPCSIPGLPVCRREFSRRNFPQEVS